MRYFWTWRRSETNNANHRCVLLILQVRAMIDLTWEIENLFFYYATRCRVVDLGKENFRSLLCKYNIRITAMKRSFVFQRGGNCARIFGSDSRVFAEMAHSWMGGSYNMRGKLKRCSFFCEWIAFTRAHFERDSWLDYHTRTAEVALDVLWNKRANPVHIVNVCLVLEVNPPLCRILESSSRLKPYIRYIRGSARVILYPAQRSNMYSDLNVGKRTDIVHWTG